MNSLPTDVGAIIYHEKSLAAAKCGKCGAKMYPRSLLRPHLNRHERKELWFAAEIRKLQSRFTRVRGIA